MKGTLSTIAAVALLATACATPADPNTKTASASSSSSSSSTTSIPPYQPRPTDFAATVKILRKKCFGSAGCNIDFRIVPTYDGPVVAGSWTVTYEVLGGQDGAQINTFTFDGEQVEYESEESVSTASSAKKLTARITDVVEE